MIMGMIATNSSFDLNAKLTDHIAKKSIERKLFKTHKLHRDSPVIETSPFPDRKFIYVRINP